LYLFKITKNTLTPSTTSFII